MLPKKKKEKKVLQPTDVSKSVAHALQLFLLSLTCEIA
jgi:hypothetical protein